MENQINKRIKLLIHNEGITNKLFCEIINIPENTLKTIFKRDTPPKLEIIEKIANKYPSYSIEWLITGCGDMTKNITINDSDGNIIGSISTGSNNDMRSYHAKKIIREDGTTELYSADSETEEISSLIAKCASLEQRVKDLEAIILNKDATINSHRETIQSLRETIEILKKGL